MGRLRAPALSSRASGPIIVVLFGIAVAIGVVGCSNGSDSDVMHARLVSRAERLCREARKRFGAMPPVHITTYSQVVSEIAGNERALAKGLARLQATGEDRASLKELGDFLARQASELDTLVAVYAGNKLIINAYHRHRHSAHLLDSQIRRAAIRLGARACAQPPVRSHYL